LANEDPIRVALFSTLNSDGVLSGLAPNGVFPDKAPQDTPTPYVIISRQDGRFESSFRDDMSRRMYLVKGVSQDKSDSEAIDARCRILLNRQRLTITGHTHISMLMDGEVDYPEETNGERYDHVGTVYRCVVQ